MSPHTKSYQTSLHTTFIIFAALQGNCGRDTIQNYLTEAGLSILYFLHSLAWIDHDSDNKHVINV